MIRLTIKSCILIRIFSNFAARLFVSTKDDAEKLLQNGVAVPTQRGVSTAVSVFWGAKEPETII